MKLNGMHLNSIQSKFRIIHLWMFIAFDNKWIHLNQHILIYRQFDKGIVLGCAHKNKSSSFVYTLYNVVACASVFHNDGYIDTYYGTVYVEIINMETIVHAILFSLSLFNIYHIRVFDHLIFLSSFELKKLQQQKKESQWARANMNFLSDVNYSVSLAYMLICIWHLGLRTRKKIVFILHLVPYANTKMNLHTLVNNSKLYGCFGSSL